MQLSSNSPNPQRIEIFTLAGLTSRGRWRFQSMQARSAHVFLWFTRGQGRIRIGATMRGFGPNTVLFIPAGQIHAIEPGTNAQGYAAYLPDSLPVPVPESPGLIKATSIFDQGQMTGYFEQISIEHGMTGPGSEHAMESYLTLLSVWIERNQMRNDWAINARLPAAARLANSFLRRLEDNHQLALSVSTYAAVLNVTPTHLSRVCRDILGRPASDLIQDRVVLAAKYALADSNQRIGDIASSLGISSAAYFTRLFRRHAGLSPREFRLQAANRNVQAQPTERRVVRRN